MSKPPSSAPPTTPAPANLAGDALADWQLVQRTLDGEQKAFELLVIKYQTRLERLVARMVRHSDSVPDIVQDSFINAYKALHQFRGDAQFYTWIYKIAINTAKNHLVSAGRRPPTDDVAVEDAVQFEGASRLHDSATPERELMRQEIERTVFATVEQLPEELKVAITLREVDGLSYEEIAETMNCPIGTVRSRIFRAREAIDEQLRPLLSEK